MLPVLLLALALVAAAACGSADEEVASPPPAPAEPTVVSHAPEETPVDAAARKLLAGEIGVGAETLVLTSAEQVEWSDASLGCPMPDFMYAQVITPGYKHVFTVEGKEYAVHSNADGSHGVVCGNVDEEVASPIPAPAEPTAVSPAPEETPVDAAARKLLADEIGVGAETLVLTSAEQVEWSDASLGCPMPGLMYAQVMTPGYKNVFTVGGKQYAVHSNADGSHGVVCSNAQ